MKLYLLLIFQFLLICQYVKALAPTAPSRDVLFSKAKLVLRERKGGNVIYGNSNKVDIGSGQDREGHNTIHGDKNYVDVEELKAKLARQQKAHQDMMSSRKMKNLFEAIQKTKRQHDINVIPKIENSPKCIKRTVLSRRKRGGNIIEGYDNRVDLQGGQDDYDKKNFFTSGREFKAYDNYDNKDDDKSDGDESKILTDHHGLLAMNDVSKFFSNKNIFSNGLGGISPNFF